MALTITETGTAHETDAGISQQRTAQMVLPSVLSAPRHRAVEQMILLSDSFGLAAFGELCEKRFFKTRQQRTVATYHGFAADSAALATRLADPDCADVSLTDLHAKVIAAGKDGRIDTKKAHAIGERIRTIGASLSH